MYFTLTWLVLCCVHFTDHMRMITIQRPLFRGRDCSMIRPQPPCIAKRSRRPYHPEAWDSQEHIPISALSQCTIWTSSLLRFTPLFLLVSTYHHRAWMRCLSTAAMSRWTVTRRSSCLRTGSRMCSLLLTLLRRYVLADLCAVPSTVAVKSTIGAPRRFA